MGTTRDAIKAGGGRFAFVAAIEGFDYLITDHSPLSAVTTAWASSSWTQAIPGLRVDGTFEQSLSFWSNELSVPSVSLVVQPDENDTLGVAVFRESKDLTTSLRTPFEAATGATSIGVLSTSGFGSTGTVYAGPSKINYSSTSGGNTFNISAGGAGVNAPFGYDGSQFVFPRPLGIADGTFTDQAPPLKITDGPKSWIGKWVGVWMHRIQDDAGNLDVQSEAELIFAGKITAVADSSTGATVISCEDVRAVIRDTTLLTNQFRAEVREGIRLYAGMIIAVQEIYGPVSASAVINESVVLRVVSSGASGAYQVNQGYLSTEAFVSKIQGGIDQAVADGYLDSAPSIKVSFFQNAGGFRTDFKSDFSGLAAGQRRIRLMANTVWPLDFLGFTPDKDTYQLDVLGGKQKFYLVSSNARTGDVVQALSPAAPYRAKVWHHSPAENVTPTSVPYANQSGTWASLPASVTSPIYRNHTTPGNDYGFISIDDKVTFFCRYDSATGHFNEFLQDEYLTKHVLSGAIDVANYGIRMGESGTIEIKQVFLMTGSFSGVLARLLGSVEGNGANHATYDELPKGMGAAIPWSLLGDNFLGSVHSIDQAGHSDSIFTWLRDPISLWELIRPDMILRNAHFVWKDGGLQVVTFELPNPADPDHVLDETNKAHPSGDVTGDRTVHQLSMESVRNVIKVEHTPGHDGKFRHNINIINQASIDNIGQTRPVTIKARNTYHDSMGAGVSVAEMVSAFSSVVAPTFGFPPKIYRRSINGTLFHAAPGDTVALSDDFARDPETGTRGVTSRGGVIVRHSWSPGHEGGELFGEVDIMATEEVRGFKYCPTVEIDASYSSGGFTNGWNSSTKQIKCVQHRYSESTESKDIESFGSGVLRIYQLDDSTEDTFEDSIASIDTANDLITLSVGFGAGGNPAFDTTGTYIATYAEFSAASTSQKTFAYLADSGDGKIADSAEPNVYWDVKNSSFTESTGNELALFDPPQTEIVAEGQALSTGLAYELISLHNNLLQYHLAGGFPWVNATPVLFDYVGPAVLSDPNGPPVSVYVLPIPGRFPPGKKRVATVAARVRSPSGGSVLIHVFLSRSPPVLGVANYFSGGFTQNPFAPDDTANMVTLSGSPSASTHGTELTSGTVDIPPGDDPLVYVLVTARNDGVGTATHEFYGLSKFLVGPLEDA